jgi:hypothetical protein
MSPLRENLEIHFATPTDRCVAHRAFNGNAYKPLTTATESGQAEAATKLTG